MSQKKTKQKPPTKQKNKSHWSHWNLPPGECFQENPLVILVLKHWTDNVTVKEAQVTRLSDLPGAGRTAWKEQRPHRCSPGLAGFELPAE